MFAGGLGGSAGWLFGLGAALLGCSLSLAAELLIARFLPRLGGPPALKTRITTAAVTGALFAALALRIGMDWALPAFLACAALAVQLARIDLAHHLLPNALVLTLLISGLVLLSINSAVSAEWSPFLRSAAGAGLLFVAYLALALISPSGIGMGDVKLAAPVGLYLGYLGWSELFYGAALGFVLGGLVSLLLVTAKGATKKAEVAFGPSMLTALLGTIFVAF